LTMSKKGKKLDSHTHDTIDIHIDTRMLLILIPSTHGRKFRIDYFHGSLVLVSDNLLK